MDRRSFRRREIERLSQVSNHSASGILLFDFVDLLILNKNHVGLLL